MVKGRADWALGYGPNKTNTGTVLLVVEAKPHDSASIGMPQLLVYMAAVHNARATRMNRSVFGMLSDGQDFRFAFLNEEKKFFTSLPFLWAPQQSTIITYIDTMLIDAIESSPHTTLQKRNNRTLCRYSQYLGRQWKFGDESDDEGAEGEEQQEEDDDDDEDDGMVDVVNIGGRVTLRFRRRLSFTG